MFKVGDEVLVKAEICNEVLEGVYEARTKNKGSIAVSDEEIVDKTYEMGLRDAWELAKKLADMKHEDYKEIFDKNGLYTVIFDYTYEEALAKIEAYEKEKEFCVGDEIVTSMGDTFIILALADGEVYGYSNDGKHEDFPVQRIECYTESGRAEKTGKHIDIESLLKKIGE